MPARGCRTGKRSEGCCVDTACVHRERFVESVPRSTFLARHGPLLAHRVADWHGAVSGGEVARVLRDLRFVAATRQNAPETPACTDPRPIAPMAGAPRSGTRSSGAR